MLAKDPQLNHLHKPDPVSTVKRRGTAGRAIISSHILTSICPHSSRLLTLRIPSQSSTGYVGVSSSPTPMGTLPSSAVRSTFTCSITTFFRRLELRQCRRADYFSEYTVAQRKMEMIFSPLLTVHTFAIGFPQLTDRTLFRRELEHRLPDYSLLQFRPNQICNCLRFLVMHSWSGSHPNYRDTSSPTTVAGVENGVRPVAGSPVDSRVEPPVQNVVHAVVANLLLSIHTKVGASSGTHSLLSLLRSHTITVTTLTNPSPRSVNLVRLI